MMPPRCSKRNGLAKSMTGALIILSFCVALLAAVLGPARRAQAALGEAAESVASDRKALSAGKGRVTARAGYTVQEILSGPTTIREYLSPDNVVFAVAWNGPSNPDLTRLLGSYAGEYHQDLQKAQRERGRRHQRVWTDRLVVEKGGHMRNLQGRAFLPQLIPPGVGIDEIR